MTTRVDISIGPVQGFVSQSRRTRDLWGSSYLLAFLSAHAMHGAVEAGGRLLVPAMEAVEQDLLYQWVRGRDEEKLPPDGAPSEAPREPQVGSRHEGEPPRIGSLPNHFALAVEGKAPEIAQAGIDSLQAAWKRVCGAVWREFVEPACSDGNGTKEIWDRQIGSFWEIMWTAGGVGDNAGAGGLLARRKRWRSHRPPEEPGDKCTVVHTLQEISGFARARDRNRQDAFWDRVRGEGRLGLLDLRDNERLCAVAFVKRTFPKIAPKALDWEVDASRWPSTVYVGAVPWMRRVMSAAPRQAAEYAEVARQSAGDGAWSTRPLHSGSDASAAGGFPKLDANYLHREFMTDERRCPLVNKASPDARKDLMERLRRLCENTDEQGRRLGPPPVFYALLLADGDRLGRLVSRLGGKPVSAGLTEFTRKAPVVVRENDGVTVYAGGDDVLAMLPIPKALACTQCLSDAYRKAFDGTDAHAAATLSAAVVFAHVRLPLNQVLDEAHRLLDTVAKERNGRDSLAVAVLKPGGPYCEWVTIWNRRALDGEERVGTLTRRSPDGDAHAVELVEALARQLDADPDSTTPGLSSALVYRIRDLLAGLCGWERWRPGSWGDVPGALDLRALLRAEIAHSLEVRMDDGATARAEHLTTSVWNLLAPARNPQGDDSGAAAASGGSASPSPGTDGLLRDGGGAAAAPGRGNAPVSQAGVDALLLARFLADPEGLESER